MAAQATDMPLYGGLYGLCRRLGRSLKAGRQHVLPLPCPLPSPLTGRRPALLCCTVVR